MHLLKAARFGVLDEPTLRLDRDGKAQFYEWLRKHYSSLDGSKVLVVSTQDEEEAESIAASLLLLHRGKVLAEGSPDFLRECTPTPSKQLR